ncbi:MAG: hypothetical protein IPP17_22990 [Bacteroidetes bacterium]|nr:hypothetical protein [Bacteroidota bacterium]
MDKTIKRERLEQVWCFEDGAEVCNGINNATLIKLEGADHSFQTLKRSGVSAEEVMTQLAEEIATICRDVVSVTS